MSLRDTLSELSRIGPAIKQAGAWTKQVFRGPVVLGKVLLSATLVLAAIVAALNFSDLVRLPFYPFATEGAIYVDSPEVYTRERLVNDRYDEDHWLREQLAKLDAAENLLTGTSSRRVEANLSGGAKTSGEKDAGGVPSDPDVQDTMHAGAAESLQLPFDQEFRIRSGVRDTIRQLLLENMLDDRHDLTGNSIYGLKFDTTVIPGVNTHKRAFVRVSVEMRPMFSNDAAPDEHHNDAAPDERHEEGERHLELYYEKDREDIEHNKENKLHRPWVLYNNWIKSIEFRLNNYISKYYKFDVQREFSVKCGTSEGKKAKDVAQNADDVAWQALEVVLGMERPDRDAKSVETDQQSSEMNITEPWSRFMRILRNQPKACDKVRISVEELIDLVYLFPNDSLGDPALYWPIALEVDGKTATVQSPFPADKQLTKAERATFNPHHKVDAKLVHLAMNNDKIYPRDKCGLQNREARDRIGSSCLLIIPSGFFNFIEKIQKKDSYSYSIFPRQEVVGMLTDESISSSLLQQVGGDSGAGAWVRLVQGLRRAATSSVLVGYGDGSSLEDEKVEFGWVVASNAGMEPVQKAQLALVSVPAWTDSLMLQIETGWLDRDSEQQDPKTVHMKVPLPPYYEAFDSFIESGEVRRQPKILNDLLEKIDLEACRDARILIPGYRLWRSTTVTLGAQAANRITILPNMEGIIAEFNPVNIPNVEKRRDIKEGVPDARAVRLRVWTSEGMDMAKKEVTIQIPDYLERSRCPLDKPAKE